MGSFWWKSGGKLLVKNILWKIFGRLGRDQLTGGDELTGRGQVDWGGLLTRPTEAAMPVVNI